jgi:hypothetical protein
MVRSLANSSFGFLKRINGKKFQQRIIRLKLKIKRKTGIKECDVFTGDQGDWNLQR